MINALQLGIDFHNALPADEVPEKQQVKKALSFSSVCWNARRSYNDVYYSRSQSRDFEARKAKIKEIQQTLNAPFDEERIKVDLFDQYYNMREVIEKICPLSKLLNKQWKNCQFNQLLNQFAVERMAQKFLI